MSEKNKKQFGVWMDSQHATIVGRKDIDTADFTILGYVKNTGASCKDDRLLGSRRNHSTAER